MIPDRIIWDFNGTIADDVDICIRCANTLLGEYGLPKIPSVGYYQSKFCFPIINYYRNLGFDFTKYPYKQPADRWVELYLSEEKNLVLRDGVTEMLDFFAENNIPQTVLSATEQSMLERELRLLGIIDRFDEIWGKNDVYASGKLSLASEWKNRHPDENAVFIGDTLHDAESAEIIGCRCVLVSGGHEGREKLIASGKDVIDVISDFKYHYL